MTVFKPTWENLKEIVETAENSLLVCSPFYSDEGIGRVFDNLNSGLAFDLVTRLSPSDWAAGVSDPESVLSLLTIYADNGTTANLHIHPRLHAKAYIADGRKGFLGSANLSAGGFQRNFELMVRLTDESAARADELIREEIRNTARPVSVDRLRAWIEQSGHHIQSAQAKIVENDSELADVQRSLDKMLGYGNKTDRQSRYTPDDMSRFVGWLKDNQNLLGSDVLLEHHENRRGGNRTGHFRQCFFIVSLFYEDYPALLGQASTELDSLDERTWTKFSDEFIESWISHFTDHALVQGDHFNYPTLRATLSPTWGGTLLSGGGAIGTLKRMLRLLARYIQEQG